MTKEIELKLKINKEDVEKFKSQDFLKAFYTSHQKKKLVSTYYDTPSLAVLEAGMALRVREENDHYIQTVKTKGEVKNGVHIRDEYEAYINENHPNIAVLPEFIQEKIKPLKKELQCVFTTEFIRDTWIIHRNKNEIELALDQGEIRSGLLSEPILEVELEMKQGDPTILLEIEMQLKQSCFLESFDISKAQRGYAIYRTLLSEQK